MALDIGREIVVEPVKPAAGGGMLAWHDGRAVLVRGAIPGERVRARIQRIGKSMLFADTTEVLTASPDRRAGGADPACGGAVLAHVSYERQVRLKGEIVRDALERIGRLPRPAPHVVPSPEIGYRMRARLHVRGGRVGFFREGTHDLCDAGRTGQLLPATAAWLSAVEEVLSRERLTGVDAIEIAENVPGSERACHLELLGGVAAEPFASLADAGALTGLSASRADRRGVTVLAGTPVVTDVLQVGAGAGRVLTLRRDVRAFFQGNRYLLEPLVRHVSALVAAGPVVDLYAGTGLFGLAVAAAGSHEVTLVEGDPVSAASLRVNAAPYHPRVRVERGRVEDFLGDGGPMPRPASAAAATAHGTFIVDPPRTGMSRAALRGVVDARPARVAYVSCDPATFARDTRMLLDAGYELGEVTGFDLFPNTAHVEVVAAFSRPDGDSMPGTPR